MHHLFDREAKLIQVGEQAGPLAWVGNSGGLEGVEVQGIVHLPKCASRDAH
ncbi:Uncharacterised protein [Mycobacterium tuberculosis]|nr:Uncharacterised protein [Mycobacterium tuberculosis]